MNVKAVRLFARDHLPNRTAFLAAFVAPLFVFSACIGGGNLGSSSIKKKTTTNSLKGTSTDAPLEDLIVDAEPVGTFIPYGTGNGSGIIVNVAKALMKALNVSDLTSLLNQIETNESYKDAPIEVRIAAFKIRIIVPLRKFAYTNADGKLIFKNTLIYRPSSKTAPEGNVDIVSVDKLADKSPTIFENSSGDIVIVGGTLNKMASPYVHRIATIAEEVSPLPYLLQEASTTPKVMPITSAIIADWDARNALMTTKINIQGIRNFIIAEGVGTPLYRVSMVLLSDNGGQVPFFCVNYLDSGSTPASSDPSSCNYYPASAKSTPGNLVLTQMSSYGYGVGETSGMAETITESDGIIVERL